MSNRKSVWAVTITAAMLLSSVLVLLSQKADAASWLTTSDTDFSPGNFFTGTGFETELHGTGVDAYVQNKKDLMSWFEKSPAADPGPRSAFGFSNDSLEGRIILFGGLDGLSSAHNDTWEYDIASNNWVRICSDNVCPPWKRSYPSMAYDNDSKIAVLYGGYAEDSMTMLTDTWEYDVTTNTWENWTGSYRPRGLTSHSMVFDTVDQRMILVGRGVASMEVWAYRQMTHTWTNMSTMNGPSKRSGFALGYSYQPAHQRVVLFGGAEVMSLYDETWEYNYVSNSWSQVSPTNKPSARAGASMTYDFQQSISGLTLFGGNSWSMETWRYNWTGGTPDWTQLTLITNPAPGRTNHGIAYDPGHDKIILYGGTSSTGSRWNDTWMLENGYRLVGRYASKFFNTYSTMTQWRYIFWNQTPANVPPNTIIRFQLETNNICNDSDLPNWRGPNGAPNTYYTTPGEAIMEGPSKCIRFLADMITYDGKAAPELQDVTIIYDGGDTLPPKVDSASPTGSNVPVNAPILINFTRPMDTGNVFISVIPNVTFGPPIWSESDTKVMYNHNAQPFLEGHRYDVCIWGTDTLGRPLDYPNGRYCWLFTTKVFQPVITSTFPTPNSIDVSLNAPVVITFSKPMNTSTCWPYVTIDPLTPPQLAFDGHSWSAGDTILTMTHSVPFAQFTTYTIEVPIGDPARPCLDKSGASLGFGPVANPWSFTTFAVNPFILVADPMNLEAEVPTNTPIKATFSKDMNTAAFYFRVEEWDVATEWWKNSTLTFSVSWVGRAVTMSHTTTFGNCKPYRVTIWAMDLAGNPLITNPNVPNPWKFMTVGPGGVCGPFILMTRPAHGEENVPLDRIISIVWYFSPPDTGGMNPSTFTFSVKDQWGNELNSHFTANWIGMGPSTVELQHPGYPFNPCQEYKVKVLTARDNSGRFPIPGPGENPFRFRTDSSVCPPVILWTAPANGTLDAPLSQPIMVKFSREMDTASVFISMRPAIAMDPPVWKDGNSNMTLTHQPFAPSTIYSVSVSGRDIQGNPLGRGPVPNPWTFRTWCAPCAPYITDTYPVNGQVYVPLDAPIWVNFSEPMDTTSLIFTLSPGTWSFSQYWSNGDTTVRLDHATPYSQCTWYTARVVSARNKTGASLVGGSAPNPWNFRSYCPHPYIVSTIPANNTLGVALDATITVTFNQAMDQTSVTFATVPSLAYTQSWTNGQTVVFSHTTPFSICQRYTATVLTARDLNGNNLGPGPVPNPWTFITGGGCTVPGLQVHRQAPDVLLTWKSDPAISYYEVFHSTNRFAPWPWTVIANLTTNSYVAANAISDMLNHFYVVRGFKLAGGWSGNSTMGALWHAVISPIAGKMNTFWFSLPYRTIYEKASDIANELTSGKINIVTKWDLATQKSLVYYYNRGRWRGDNFDIFMGDGLWLGVVNAFDWAVNGTDTIHTLTFKANPSPKQNYNFISLPYTNAYPDARSISDQLTSSKVAEVGRWDAVSQTWQKWTWSGGAWTGVNFAILPGDGIYLLTVADFTWAPRLITPEVP